MQGASSTADAVIQSRLADSMQSKSVDSEKKLTIAAENPGNMNSDTQKIKENISLT